MERRQKLFDNKWRGYGWDLNLWNNLSTLTIKSGSFDEDDDDDDEFNSSKDETAESDDYVHVKCNMSKMGLVDIDNLMYQKHLQYLNISHNNLNDLSPLDTMHQLIYLNASHNKIKDILNFNPPCYLTYVNLSHNRIKKISDLSGFWSIVKLNLSHNEIERITGLQSLRYLRDLNLSYNLIETVENLDNLMIEELNLENNCISVVNYPSLKILANLRNLLLACNEISSLNFLQDTYSLDLIDLKSNKVTDLLQVSHLKGNPVYEIDLRGNSCTKWPHYKDLILFSLPHVFFVDGSEVTIAEKIAASTKFEPPIDLFASQCIRKLILLEQLSFPRINDNVVPFDEPEPFLIILSGPSASKKIRLGLQIAQLLSKNVRYCPSYTTREFSTSTLESQAYSFVERDEFNEMTKKGEFLTVEELVGDSYGFHESEIGVLRNERKIGIAQMDLQATIQMKIRYPKIKLVLVLVKDEAIHRQWIQEKFQIFTWIKDSVDNLLALTIGKRSSELVAESERSRVNFAGDIIDKVIDNLELPLVVVVANDDDDDDTIESEIILPRKTITRTEIGHENKIKHITFDDDSRGDLEHVNQDSDELLKIVLDEQSNVIVDDVEARKKRKKAKLLYRRKTQDDSDDEFESETSEESQEESFPRRKKLENSKSLMNSYIDFVLKSRQDYVNQHLNNPGFYSLLVFTDKFESNAVKLLTSFIKNLSIKQANQSSKPPEIEYINTRVFPMKINELADILSSPEKR